MRIRSLVLAIAFCFALCLPVAAATVAGDGLSVSVPDDYLIITQDNVKDNAEAAKVLGFTDKTLKTHMKDNGILFLGLIGNNTRQIQFRELQGASDSYATKIDDLSLLSNESIRNSADLIMQGLSIPVGSRFEIVANTSGLKAIKITIPDEETVSVQYVTVRNGIIYSLVGYDSPAADMSYLADMFESLNIKRKSNGFTVSGATQIITTIIVVLLIAVAVVVIVRLIISFVIDYRNRDNDVREFVRIKRRKF